MSMFQDFGSVRNNMGHVKYEIEKEQDCIIYENLDNKYYAKLWITEHDRDQGLSDRYYKDFNNLEEAIKDLRKYFNDGNCVCIEIYDKNDKLYYACDNESEDFYLNEEKISLVDKKIVNEYIDNWNNNKKQTFTGKKLYCHKNNKYIAIDNETGHCWVEEFDSEKETQDWLLGNKLEEIVAKTKIGVYSRICYKNEEELKKHYTILENILKNHDFYDTKKYELKLYEDLGYSGLDNNRPSLNNMILDMENKKLDIIVTTKIEELSRDVLFLNFKLYPTFEDFNVDLITSLGKVDFSNLELSNEKIREIINKKYGEENEL